jgi:hypothetical protein
VTGDTAKLITVCCTSVRIADLRIVSPSYNLLRSNMFRKRVGVVCLVSLSGLCGALRDMQYNVHVHVDCATFGGYNVARIHTVYMLTG